MLSSLKQLELLSQQKYDIQAEYYPEWCNPNKYVEELNNEIKEVTEEIKTQNTIHLQDELGDIIWDFLWLVESLRRQWMIDSLSEVLVMAEKKYSERVEVCHDQWWRDRIKKKQKIELKEKHQAKYGI
jgi:NTP pyrophosphatase (non-canonical NTP hydrolase)